MSLPTLNLPQNLQSDTAKERLDNDSENDIIDYLNIPGGGKTSDSTGSAKHELAHPDAFRSLTASPLSDYGGRLSPFSVRASSPLPILANQSWKARNASAWREFWIRNRLGALVAIAQLFGALMNLSARLLELEGEGMHPFQILFARMTLTTLFSCIYAIKTGVPHFPLGPPGVRWLLVIRGFTGFFGIYGMWYSMQYLPLADATVITFLGPMLTGYICHIFMKDPFTRKEQLASYLALAGVVFIAKPSSFFHSSAAPPTTGAVEMVANATMQAIDHRSQTTDEATPAQRLSAIAWAMVGVLGGSTALAIIRGIGKRAHTLVSVNYFSVWCVVVSITALTVAPLLGIGQPELHFALPGSMRQWLLLIALGICGFTMQVLLTAGVAGERSNRATAMVYTHMLFAAGFDRWVFHHEMGVLSLIGCGLIVGSALWVALTKVEGEKKREDDLEPGDSGTVEAVPMLSAGMREMDGIQLQQVR